MKFNLHIKAFVMSIVISTLLIVNITGYTSAYALTHYRAKNLLALGYPRLENKKTPTDFGLFYTSDAFG